MPRFLAIVRACTTMSACAVLQPYSPSAFSELLDFDVVLPKVPQIDAASHEISRIFLKHKMEGFAGMAMLHKHFELSDTEMLVEEIRGCHSVIRPVTLGTDCTNLLPYMFKLKCEGHGFVLVPTEFAPAELVSRANFEHMMSDGEFVNELGRNIADLQALDFIGLCLLHRSHVQEVDGSTCEFTDHNLRELVVVPSSQAVDRMKDNDGSSFTTKTIWTFGSRLGEDICHHCMHCGHKD